MERRVAWLQDVVLELDLDNVTLRRARVEEVRDRFNAVTARAVANLTKLVRITAPILRRGGCLLALKGAKAEAETEAAKYVIKKAKLDPAIIHEVVTPGEELTKVVEVRRPKR
jgi:ribosomal RNA small subunit methyltransferase G